ncbi:MAG: hypothetical protein LCH46_12285 [Proteobacteria bacterium]|nr:hypothetical protein [Pseudomonadota bacterium]
MAFVALSGGSSGNLNVSQYSYGYFADTVIVIDNPSSASYTIKTYEDNDIIDLRRGTSGGLIATIYAGSENDRVYGSAGSDTVYDGSGNDIISLGRGADLSFVGTGNDYIDGGEGIDTVDFSGLNDDGFGATDSAGSNTGGITLDLKLRTAQNLGYYGTDSILNFENVNGSPGNDTIYGTDGANIISGGYGDDKLYGRGGDDTIHAWIGKSLIVGGSGKDTIELAGDFAGQGPHYPSPDAFSDRVSYLAVSDSTPTGFDTIWAFNIAGTTATTADDDKIDISALDGNTKVSGNQAFTWRGNAASFGTNAAGEVRWQAATADGYSGIKIFIDTDADADAEMVIFIGYLTSIGQADFIL